MSRMTTSRTRRGRVDAAAGDVDDRRPGRRAVDGDVERPAERLELVGGGRPVRVGGTSSGRRPCLTRLASFAADVVLPEPCRPTRAMTAGLPLRWNVRSPALSRADELVVDDLHDLLAGVQAPRTSAPTAFLADARDEVLDDLEVDVGLEQGKRISRIAASTSASLIRPRPVRSARVLRRRSLRCRSWESGTPWLKMTGSSGDGPRARVVDEFWPTEALAV